MCSQGYVIIRVDMRGTGDSDGFYHDEYEQQEQDDCIEVIDWIKKQHWCSGYVGMVGKSWGGFNGLQVASRNPEGLKAIISVCSTDDRYDDNSHYKGGCIVASQMLSWACYMFTFNMSPPDPHFVGTKWRDIWLERLKQGEPWVNKWLSHQTRDKYWEHGSICEDYSKIKCAVFLIGGWFDCYHNAIFRMAEKLSCNWQAVVGPWPHEFPDDCVPGPKIGYLYESLRFWDYHLKGIQNGLDKVPRLRLYLRESVSMSPKIETCPGRWISEDQWPCQNVSIKKFILTCSGLLLPKEKDSVVLEPSKRILFIPTSLACGSAGGSMIPANETCDLALDQAVDDQLCRCWHGDILETIDILGAPSVQLEISCDQPLATLCVRLVDVFPDGRSTLISIGFLNLAHRDGHTVHDIKALTPGQHYLIQLKLDVTGYTIYAGHQLRLALSQSYWPYGIWPPPSTSVLQLHFLSPPVFTLPLRERSKDIDVKDQKNNNLGTPVFSPKLPIKEMRKPSFKRLTSHNIQSSSYKTTLSVDEGEIQRLDNNIIFGLALNEDYEIIENEPLSAKVTIETSTRVARKEAVSGSSRELFDTFVITKSVLSADECQFHSHCEVKAWCGDELVFENQWKKDIPRFYV